MPRIPTKPRQGPRMAAGKPSPSLPDANRRRRADGPSLESLTSKQILLPETLCRISSGFARLHLFVSLRDAHTRNYIGLAALRDTMRSVGHVAFACWVP
jgi:hypothetical protein